MKMISREAVIAVLFASLTPFGTIKGGNIMSNEERSYIRPASVAGAFYPESPSELAKMIAGQFYAAPKPAISEKPLVIISPHAGYVYSGGIAARGYKILQGEIFKTVIVISPSHTIYFAGVTVFGGTAYTTPLGEIPIDTELSERIATLSDRAEISNVGHVVSGGRSEHALEVQLPFLQTILGKFKLAAIMMGDQDLAACESLGKAIGGALAGRDDVLIVASSDLSHFHSSGDAKKLDSRVIKSLELYDYRGLAEALSAGKTEACGGGPIIAAMIAARELGGNTVEITGYSDSGDITGDHGSVVGYLSAVIYKSQTPIIEEDDDDTEAYELDIDDDEDNDILNNPASGIEFGLSVDDKKTLLEIARESIRAKLYGEELVLPAVSGSISLNQGAFVTLNKNNRLRGCIGTFSTSEPLYKTITEMACQAAFSDPRFPPVEKVEFELLDIEISVLSPMKRIDDPDLIEIGRDGLYIKNGFSSGVLLPQVPVEYDWDRKTFLEQTCRKAGLGPDVWKEEDTELYLFQAEIFGEE